MASSSVTTTATASTSDTEADKPDAVMKRKPSPHASTSSLPDNTTRPKRSRVDSTGSQSSVSWLQRLGYNPSRSRPQSTASLALEKSNRADKDKSEPSTQDTDKEDARETRSTGGNSVNTNHTGRGSGGGGSGGGDDDDDDDDEKKSGNGDTQSTSTHDTSKHQQQQGGVWSWFGYGNAIQPTDESVKAPKKHEMQEKAKAPSASPASTSTSSSSNEPAATHPPSAPPASSEADPSVQGNNRPSYWRSFFWFEPKNTSKQDSVIVESSDNNQQQDRAIRESQQQQIDPVLQSGIKESPPSPSPPPPPASSTTTKPRRKNVVLPTIGSQFTHTTADPNNTSLLSRALNVINAMFDKSAATHDRRLSPKFAQFVRAMKARPDTMAGKKFVVIGVHGWFPMKLVRSMIGEPTGTSTKFCEQMVAGAKHYFESQHGITIPDHAITSIALEGEGKVEERVQRLYENLMKSDTWLDAIESADIILWATHSQGTPVSIMLLQRLIEEKRIQLSRQSICVLAMAGIAHGPFPFLKGSLIVKYFEADAARELFEFMDSNSDISQKFRSALTYLLHHGIKLLLVGSMQDQVVPLYSAIMAGAYHPSILRAIYIDGHIYSKDDFLVNLITFALRLRNAGFSDHGLLTHISEVLAGNLYAWEGGHSTIYEERDVYTMAVQYLFETEPFGNLALPTRSTTTDPGPQLEVFQAKMRQNPFYLPWAMRGICDDARVLGDETFSRELDTLRSLFDQWVPSSTRLREVKFRLEPLKARL